jgi:hypothetical protein
MRKQSFIEILNRTLDYLARKHPWFDAILRNSWVAFIIIFLYLAVIVNFGYYVHSGEEGGWKEIVKSYSPLFFDLFIIFIVSSAFLLARGYFIEENTRINKNELPDPSLFISLTPTSVNVTVDDKYFFQRHGAISAILDALPIEQSDFFLAHAGSLDIPKLILTSIESNCEGVLTLRLGVCSFKEFFFTHHFADYPLSRSSSRDSGNGETLRSLFSPVYFRSYLPFFEKKSNKLDLLSYTPNTLGVTGCIQLIFNEINIVIFQWRGYHESAARGVLQLGYAGTLSAYPDFTSNAPKLSLIGIANDEFEDEFLKAEPGQIINKIDTNYRIDHKLVGFCINSQYLFQPEIFILTKIFFEREDAISKLLKYYSHDKGRQFVAFESLDSFRKFSLKSEIKIRPLCNTAINNIYINHI